jgi:hypothetical protein
MLFAVLTIITCLLFGTLLLVSLYIGLVCSTIDNDKYKWTCQKPKPVVPVTPTVPATGTGVVKAGCAKLYHQCGGELLLHTLLLLALYFDVHTDQMKLTTVSTY